MATRMTATAAKGFSVVSAHCSEATMRSSESLVNRPDTLSGFANADANATSTWRRSMSAM